MAMRVLDEGMVLMNATRFMVKTVGDALKECIGSFEGKLGRSVNVDNTVLAVMSVTMCQLIKNMAPVVPVGTKPPFPIHVMFAEFVSKLLRLALMLDMIDESCMTDVMKRCAEYAAGKPDGEPLH